MRPREIQPCARELDGAPAPADKVHNQRDHGEDQKQVDQKSGYVKESEAAEPEDHKNNCQDQEHRGLLSLSGFDRGLSAKSSVSERPRPRKSLLYLLSEQGIPAIGGRIPSPMGGVKSEGARAVPVPLVPESPGEANVLSGSFLSSQA